MICKTKVKVLIVLFAIVQSLNAEYNMHCCGFDNYLDSNVAVKDNMINHFKKRNQSVNQKLNRRNYTYNVDTTYVIKVVLLKHKKYPKQRPFQKR